MTRVRKKMMLGSGKRAKHGVLTKPKPAVRGRVKKIKKKPVKVKVPRLKRIVFIRHGARVDKALGDDWLDSAAPHGRYVRCDMNLVCDSPRYRHLVPFP